MAILIGGLSILLGFVLQVPYRLILTVSLSLVAAIFSSVITGLFIPYLFRRVHMDPANASGPIATVIQDFLSVVIYFLIASRLLG